MFQGRTPLHVAVMNNQLKVVNLLIKYGASMSIVDNEVCCINVLNSQ